MGRRKSFAMNRTWPVIVILSLVLLGGLAVVQWQKNRQLNENLTDVEAVYVNQKRTLTEQEESIGKLKQELAQIQYQFVSGQDEAEATRARLLIAEKEILQITWDRDQLQAALTNSAAIGSEQAKRLQETQTQLATTQQQFTAVKSQLTEAGAGIERLTNQLQAARLKLSQLTTSHDVLVARYNSLTAHFNATSAPAMSWLK